LEDIEFKILKNFRFFDEYFEDIAKYVFNEKEEVRE
jgi:hypothetical protein